MPGSAFSQGDFTSALPTECRDAVAAYATLCTTTPAWAEQLAQEALARASRSTSSPVGTEPLPKLLVAVRTTAADWAVQGCGGRLDQELLGWLASEQAACRSRGRAGQPLAARALSDMPESDGAFLWLVEVESLSLPEAARLLDLGQVGTHAQHAQMDRVRTVFRERVLRHHIDAAAGGECRGYARMLGAVTRLPGTSVPEDLARHLAMCRRCTEAEVALRARDDVLARLLARDVLGWGGLAYLERRRVSPERSLGVASLGDAEGLATGGGRGGAGPRAGRPLRRAKIVAAVAAVGATVAMFFLLSSTASDVTEVARPEDSPGPDAPLWGSVPGAGADRSTPSAALPAQTSSPSAAPTTGAQEPGESGRTSAPLTDGSSSAAAPVVSPASLGTPASCDTDYELIDQWADGFKASLTVTSYSALDDWRLGWTFPDGQRLTYVYGGTYDQSGSRVVVEAEDYNRDVAAGESFQIYFLGEWENRNTPPGAVSLNNRGCST